MEFDAADFKPRTLFYAQTSLLNIIFLLIELMNVMNMRIKGIVALLILAMVVAGATLTAVAQKATPMPTAGVKYPDWVFVNIKNGAFVPDNTTIAKGGYVIWTNTDNSTNSVKVDSYEKKLGKGAAWTKTFPNTGVYKFTNGNKTSTITVI